MFSGCIERVHWEQMGQHTKLYDVFVFLVFFFCLFSELMKLWVDITVSCNVFDYGNVQ